MDIDVIDLVETEKIKKKGLSLELSGVVLKEELDVLINICSNKESGMGLLVPLYIVFNEDEHFIGDFRLNSDNLLSLLFISNDYRLTLINNDTNERVAMLKYGIDDIRKDNQLNDVGDFVEGQDALRTCLEPSLRINAENIYNKWTVVSKQHYSLNTVEKGE